MAAANQRQLRHSNTRRTGYTDRETVGSLMVPVPDFQMNHGDSGILNLTYRLDATNQIQNFVMNPN